MRGAIAALGRGGLLAESTAPGIVELFEELREDLRSRVLGSREISALAAWTESAEWRHLRQILLTGKRDAAPANNNHHPL